MSDKLKVINLFSGPCCGKSTTRAELFVKMKRNHLDIEEVSEYAKDLVWAGRQAELANQLQVIAKQYGRQKRLIGKVDLTVSDSPLLLSIIYSDETQRSLKNLVMDLWEEFDNLNIFLIRPEGIYNPNGRTQNEEAALEIDNKIEIMLKYYSIPYIRVPLNDYTTDTILRLASQKDSKWTQFFTAPQL